MVRKADLPAHIIDTALTLAAERGWAEISLNHIARAAKLPLSEVYGLFASKTAILAAFSRRLDAEILATLDADATEAPVRERLFDVLMKRFDALNPHKGAIANILRHSCADPLAAISGLAPLGRSMAWMLEGAGIGTQGPLGLVRIKGLSMIYLSALVVWLRDDSSDMAKTMAHLDKRLRQAESCIVALQCRRRQGASPAGAEAA
jgi:AcrR family transcriptional regulator